MILLAEKYASISNPVFCLIVSSQSSLQIGAVRRSCHTIALCTGLPVLRSQTIVVSRWLVTPTARMSRGAMPARSIASRAVASWLSRIYSGSCSTRLGCG